jgi:hypothetical protein
MIFSRREITFLSILTLMLLSVVGPARVPTSLTANVQSTAGGPSIDPSDSPLQIPRSHRPMFLHQSAHEMSVQAPWNNIVVVSAADNSTAVSVSAFSLTGEIGIRTDVTMTSFSVTNDQDCVETWPLTTKSCFSIQQNLYVTQPSDPSNPKYWVQNTIGIWKDIWRNYHAGEEFFVFDYGTRSQLACSPKNVAGMGCIEKDHSASFPHTFSLSASISGGSVFLQNEFSSYSYPVESGSVLSDLWEIDVLGDGSGSNAAFQSGTSGSVRTYVQLSGISSWVSGTTVHQNVIYSPLTSAETSSNLKWSSNGDGSYSFSYLSGGHDDGLIAYPEFPWIIESPRPQG